MKEKAKRRRTKKSFKNSQIQIRRNKIEIFFHKLQQIIEKYYNDQVLQDILLHTDSKKQGLSERDSSFVSTNVSKKESAHNNYMCHCKHLSEIPSNMFLAFHKKPSRFVGRYEVELSFIQAIIWLKSVTARIPQISVEKLQQLFDEQLNARDNCNFDENQHIEDVRVDSSLLICVDRTWSNKMLDENEKFVTPTLENTFDSTCNSDPLVSPMFYKSHINSEDIQSEVFSFAASSSNDRNNSISKLEISTPNVITNRENKKELLSKSYINPDSNVDSLLDLSDLFEGFDNMQAYQDFEYKPKISKNCNERINDKIIEDEGNSPCINQFTNSSKDDANTSNECNSISLSRCQSIESILNLKDFNDGYITPISGQHDVIKTSDWFPNCLSNIKYFNDECITPMTNQFDVISQVESLISANSLNNINLSPRSFSISYDSGYHMIQEQKNVDNFQTDRMQSNSSFDFIDDDFEYQIDDNNSWTSKNNTEFEQQNHDSAYSTWEIETLNCDVTTTTKSIIVNNRTSAANIEHHYNLESREKQGEVTVSPSLIQKPIRKRSSSKTHKLKPTTNISKKEKENEDKIISTDVSNFTIESLNSEHAEKQNHTWEMETLNNDTTITTKFITDNNRTSVANIGHHYNLRPRKKQEEAMVFSSLIQKPIRKRSSSKTHKSKPAKRISKKEKENKNKITSTDVSNFTIESLNSEHAEEQNHTWEMETFNNDTTITTKSITDNKRTSVANIGHYYNLRPRKKQEEAMVSPSLIQKPIQKRSSPKTHKSKPAKKISKKEKENKDKITSTDVSNFTMESLNSEHAEKQNHTWEMETLNNNTTITTKFITDNKRTSVANIGYYYNLRPRKKQEEAMVSLSMNQKPVLKRRFSTRKQSSSKKRKSEPSKNISKKIMEDEDEIISVDWLNSIVESSNLEHTILTSFKVIISTLCNKKTAQKYAVHRCWKGSLEEEAMNAMLDMVDIFRIEKKSDIFAKEIEDRIIKTLDEMITSGKLNETSIWIYRMQIILKFCNILSICVKTINYLIAMLETLQNVLINATNESEQIRDIEINQLYLVSYMLEMVLRTYRVLVPSDTRSRSTENADPWKIHYYRIENEELDDANFSLCADTIETQWINVLQKFTVASVKHLVQFVDVSCSLYHILIPV